MLKIKNIAAILTALAVLTMSNAAMAEREVKKAATQKTISTDVITLAAYPGGTNGAAMYKAYRNRCMISALAFDVNRSNGSLADPYGNGYDGAKYSATAANAYTSIVSYYKINLANVEGIETAVFNVNLAPKKWGTINICAVSDADALYSAAANGGVTNVGSDSLPTDGSVITSATYGSSSGTFVDRSFDVSEYIKSAVNKGQEYAYLKISCVTGTNGVYDIGHYITNTGSKAPTLTIGGYSVNFTANTNTVYQFGTTEGAVVDKANPTSNTMKLNWTANDILTSEAGNQDTRLFLKTDISTYKKFGISSFVITLSGSFSQVVGINVYKVTGNWDTTTICYNNMPAYDAQPIVSMLGLGTTDTTRSIDLTAFVNSMTDSKFNIMITMTFENDNFVSGKNHSVYGIKNGGGSPGIPAAVTYETEAGVIGINNINVRANISDLASGTEVVPIVALYDVNGNLLKTLVSDTMTAGTVEKAKIAVDTSELTNTDNIKVFMWTGWDAVKPVYEYSEIWK